MKNMYFGIAKILGILSFGAGMFFGIFPGECWRTKSFHSVADKPLVALLALIIEIFFVWIIVDLKKKAKGEQPMTLAKLSSPGTGVTPDGLPSYRIAFLLGVVCNTLGLVSGFMLALNRYR
jgi:hypothetical protein